MLVPADGIILLAAGYFNPALINGGRAKQAVRLALRQVSFWSVSGPGSGCADLKPNAV
jgi:hypothetical protein